VVEASKDRLLVGCGAGAVSLEEVVPEGRSRMSGAEFARGRRLELGERLG
jgi:methionyl-tRNA formyltransferase